MASIVDHTAPGIQHVLPTTIPWKLEAFGVEESVAFLKPMRTASSDAIRSLFDRVRSKSQNAVK